MDLAIRTEPAEALAELVHDLRQPLGTLEYSAAYLRILLGETPAAVEQQLRLIEQQINLAARLVSEAAASVPCGGIQRAAAGASLDLTKSETAAVT